MIRHIGGIALMAGRIAGAWLRLRVDREECVRALGAYGVGSLPVALATAVFVGMVMVLQAAVYVRTFGVYNLLGWFAGFSTLREVAPVLVGLMLSGRVGASHTSELAVMQATEQLDALRILALDIDTLLIAPRALSMVVAMVALVVFGDAVALVSGAVCAKFIVGVNPDAFFMSMVDRLTVHDFAVGLYKAAVFGGAVASVSSYFGLSASRSAQGVREAVLQQVVASAVAIFVMDYLMTSVLR